MLHPQKILFFPIILLTCFFQLQGQLLEKLPDKLRIEQFGYPDFGEGFEFGSFTVSYPIASKTDVIVKGLYEKTPISEVFEAQLMVRRKLFDKLYLLGGLRQEWDLFSAQNGVNIRNNNGDKARKEAVLGLEYHPKPNLIINASYQQLLNNPQSTPRGFNRANAKLSSRFRF